MTDDKSAGRGADKTIYAQKWAMEVLGRYEDAYPRGTEFLCESLQISRRQLSNYIRFNDPLWEILRQGGKITEHYMVVVRKHGARFFSQLEIEDQYTIVQYFYDYVVEKRADRIVKRLDNLWFDTHNLMRSDSRGGGAAMEQSDMASPPS